VRESQGFDPNTQPRHSCANVLRNTATIARKVAGRQGFVPIPGETESSPDVTLIGLPATNEAEGE